MALIKNNHYSILLFFWLVFSNFSVWFTIKFENKFKEDIKTIVVYKPSLGGPIPIDTGRKITKAKKVRITFGDTEKPLEDFEFTDNYFSFLLRPGESLEMDGGDSRNSNTEYNFLSTYEKFIFRKGTKTKQISAKDFHDSLINEDFLIFFRPYRFDFPFCEDCWFLKCKDDH
ncbi:MAG: hypothetical protein IPL26_23900 [Leptospiraceae bacterium]|nr:hypothetical protein [Leptospiraceae bacterium]